VPSFLPVTPFGPADVSTRRTEGPCSKIHTIAASFPTLSTTSHHPLPRQTTYRALVFTQRHLTPTHSLPLPLHLPLTMASGRNSPPLYSPSASDRRRASVTGQTFQDLFGRSTNHAGQPPGSQSYSGPITSAAVNAQRRRLSLTTIGLSASPGQTSPFTNPRNRTESISSVNSGSVDESPFEDDYSMSASATSSNSATPFARRLSFGARALRDVRQGSGSVGHPNGRPSVHKASSPPTGRGRGLSSLSHSLPSASLFLLPPSPPAGTSPRFLSISHRWPSTIAEQPEFVFDDYSLTSSSTGEGYNFAENLRSRAERGSISGPPSGIFGPNGTSHQRAKSVATMEPPAREIPKQPKVPDAMQERILKGDFYMD